MVKDRAAIWISVLAGFLILGGLFYLTRDRSLTGHNDFLSLYTGATLAGSPGLYSLEANQKVHLAATGTALEFVFFRPPYYAVLLKPLAWLPYRAAYLLFQLIALGSIAWFLRAFGRETPELIVFASLSVPLYCAFLNGQDTGIATAIAGAAVVALRRGKDTLAGLIFSLATIKFHLFILVPLALIMHRRWHVLKGGAIGGLILAGISFLSAGFDWPQRYIAALGNPALHQAAANSATLRSAAEALAGGSPVMLVGLSLLVVVIAGWIAWSTPDTEIALAGALVASLLIAFHATAHDMTVLLLPLALVLSRCQDTRVRGMAALLASPILGICVFLGAPFSVAAPGVGMLFLLVLARSLQVQTAMTRAEGLAS